MMSVLIETRNHEDALGRTLASLVPAAVEGLVREVIVCDLGSTDQTHRVADHAGCHYVASGGLRQGIRQAKGEWLLILEPGSRLLDGWMEPVIEHIQRQTIPARLTRTRTGQKALLSRLFGGRQPLSEGLIVSKPQAIARNAPDGPALARALSARRLPAGISPASA